MIGYSFGVKILIEALESMSERSKKMEISGEKAVPGITMFYLAAIHCIE